MDSVTNLEDRAAIADLVALYAVAVDSRTFDRLDQVFADDGVLETAHGVRRGLPEIVAAMQGLLRYESTHHVVGQTTLEPAGDGRVAGVTYCEAHHLSVEDEGKVDQVKHIRYHDTFVQTPKGWRIAARRLEVSWTDERTIT